MNVNRPDHPGRSRDALGKIFDSMMADLGKQPSAKQAAIANADAHTNNAGLPTYSELVAALRATSGQLADYHLKGHMSGWDKALADSHAMLRRIPA